MAIQIQYRRGTAAEWTSANPTLAEGEPGYETDTGKFKVGDGSTAWTSLVYSSGIKGDTGETGPQGIQGIQGIQGETGPTGPAGGVNSVNGLTGAVDLSSVYQPLDSDLTAFAAKTAPTGAVVGTTDSQTLSNKTINSPTITGAIYANGSVRSNIVAVSAMDIDCSTGNYFTKGISSSSTFSFSNVPSGQAYSFIVEVTHTGGTITWPTSVKWATNTAPTLTTGKTHLFIFVTDDAGARWRGAALVDYVN
jgi:hypothetical protein